MNEATQKVQPEPSDVLTDAEVAKALRLSVHKVRRMRYAVPPRGPRFFRVDRSVRYTRAAVESFISAATVGTLQQPLDTERLPTSRKRSNRTAKQSGGRHAA